MSKVIKEKSDSDLQDKHSFKLGISFLVWFAIALLAVALVMVIMYKNPQNIFKGYEQAKTALTIATGVISLIAGGIALYINWITTSLLLLAGFKVGGNKEVTYRSVLYYFLKNSWVFAVWIALILIGTLIWGTSFITSAAGVVITGVLMLGMYMLILMKMERDFTIKKQWVYIIFAVVIAAVIALSMIYTGKLNYAGELGGKV